MESPVIPPVDIWSLLFDRPSLPFPRHHGELERIVHLCRETNLGSYSHLPILKNRCCANLRRCQTTGGGFWGRIEAAMEPGEGRGTHGDGCESY